MLFDAAHAKETYPTTRPLDQQDERESQRLWKKVTDAIKAQDQNIATDEKSRIEDMQRQEASQRSQEGVEWKPKLFRSTHDGKGGLGPDEESLDWIINAKVYVDPWNLPSNERDIDYSCTATMEALLTRRSSKFYR